MKPLGLEGRVGAPAIVRENPLLRVYDDCASKTDDWMMDRRFNPLDAVDVFTWDHLLEVIATRYRDDDGVLRAFVKKATLRIPEPVLRYDLPTPRFHLSISRHPMLTHQTVVMSGSCEHVTVSGERSSMIVTGRAGAVHTKNGIVVADDASFVELDLGRSGFGVCASPGVDVETQVLLGASGLLLSSIALRYPRFFYSPSAICDPAEDPRFQRLSDDVLAAAKEPGSFYLRAKEFRNRAVELRTDMRRSMKERRDPLVRSGHIYQHYHQFIPRGASR